MSKSIYEKALESLKKHHEVTDMIKEIKALEQAQKQQQEHIEYSKKVQMQFSNDTKRIGELESKLIKQDKLLELYKELTQKQKLYISYEEKLEDLIYDYTNDNLNEKVYVELIKKYNTDYIENDIERLEKQIKELENEQ